MSQMSCIFQLNALLTPQQSRDYSLFRCTHICLRGEMGLKAIATQFSLLFRMYLVLEMFAQTNKYLKSVDNRVWVLKRIRMFYQIIEHTTVTYRTVVQVLYNIDPIIQDSYILQVNYDHSMYKFKNKLQFKNRQFRGAI